MSRAVRPTKSREDLENMSLARLNTEIRYLGQRERLAGTGVAAKAFRKRREVAERIRDKQFGVVSRSKGG
jgi:hypothetical protein